METRNAEILIKGSRGYIVTWLEGGIYNSKFFSKFEKAVNFAEFINWLEEENKMKKLTDQQKSEISFAISGYLQDMPNVFQYGGGLDICLDYETAKYPQFREEVAKYVKAEYKKITSFDN